MLSKLASKITILITYIFLSQQALAQVTSVSNSCEAPLELEWLDEDVQLAGTEIITDQTISEQGLATPSLWWAKEQFDPYAGRLINNWIAYQDKHRIDLIVNRQLWSILDYLARYQFVNKLGTVARDYQYNLRVFNQQKKCLATYTCDFNFTPNQCEINFEQPSGRPGLQIEATLEQK